MLPFIMYLNCIHDGHHISVLLLLLEKCIVNQPRGYGGCSSLNSDVWPRAPPRFLPFSTNCVACGFEKGFSLIALKVGHFLSCIFHQDSLVQKRLTMSHCLKITQNVAFEFLTFWHFPPIFVLLKLTCLVTLFDRKL